MNEATILILFLGIAALILSGLLFTMDFDSRVMQFLQIAGWIGMQFVGVIFTFHGMMLDPFHLFTWDFWTGAFGGGSPNTVIRLCASTTISVCVPFVIIFLLNRITMALDERETGIAG